MNTNAIAEELGQQVKKINMQDCCEKEKKVNSGLCMSAGIETATDADQSRFQRRHFPNKMTSNIFFCDEPPEDNVSSNNSTEKENFTSGKNGTGYDDEKLSEQEHFDLSSETFVQPGNNAVGEEEIDSSERAVSTDVETNDTDEKVTQKRHFHDKTSSNIFFSGLPSEDISRNRTDPTNIH